MNLLIGKFQLPGSLIFARLKGLEKFSNFIFKNFKHKNKNIPTILNQRLKRKTFEPLPL
jgi:hypothetical protein